MESSSNPAEESQNARTEAFKAVLQDAEKDKLLLYRMLFRLQLLAATGCALVLFHSLQSHAWRECLRILGVGIAIGGASILTDLTFGFIFCYPRVKRGDVANAAQSANEIADNSSLADISDWLTKIIVGVGLVELYKLPSFLHHLSIILAPGLVSDGGSLAAAQVFGLALLLYFFPLGFMFGYIWTRFWYQEALKKLLSTIQKQATVIDSLEMAQEASRLADQADAKVDEKNIDEASSLINQALKLDAKNPKALFVKGRVLRRQAEASGTYDKALLSQALLYMTQAAQGLPKRASPLYNMACYEALLGQPEAVVTESLRKAFEINPAVVENARTDDDFKSVRGAVDALIAEFDLKRPKSPQTSKRRPSEEAYNNRSEGKEL